MWRNGPSRYSVSIRFVSGQSVTRLANLSRNTLNEITRSASITSPPPGMGVRALMRAAEFQGRNFGIARDIGHQIVHLLRGVGQDLGFVMRGHRAFPVRVTCPVHVTWRGLFDKRAAEIKGPPCRRDHM